MAELKHWNAENFAAETADGVVLVDFFATWCGPCKMLAPVLQLVAEELGDSAKVGKVDIDEAQDLAIRFGVRSVPSLFVLKNGEVTASFVGVQSKDKLIQAVRAALA